MTGPASTETVASVVELGELASDRLAAVIGAFRQGDAEAAHAVWLKDTEIDERHDVVLARIVTEMMSAPERVSDGAHLLFIAKNLERIGDHATNIAELVYYQITGGELADRPKL
eukprot:gene15651-biopygen13863